MLVIFENNKPTEADLLFFGSTKIVFISIIPKFYQKEIADHRYSI